MPGEPVLAALLNDRLALWQRLEQEIEARYDIIAAWGPGGRNWRYESKYRKGGRTLCALYAREGEFGLLVIFGAAEREKFESRRGCYSEFIRKAYEAATTYHDGKWVMFQPETIADLDGLADLLAIKRKPEKSQSGKKKI